MGHKHKAYTRPTDAAASVIQQTPVMLAWCSQLSGSCTMDSESSKATLLVTQQGGTTSLLSISLSPTLFFPSPYNSSLAQCRTGQKGQNFMQNTVIQSHLKIKRHPSSWEQSSTLSSLVCATANFSRLKTINFISKTSLVQSTVVV